MRKLLAVLLIGGAFGLGLWLRWHTLPSRQLDLSAQIKPDKKYTVLLWDFDRPLPEGGSYYEELQHEIKVFNEFYPNISVELKLLSWDQKEEVAAAIKRRQGLPDVLATGPLTDLTFACEALLPARYFTPEDQEGYVPLALVSGGVGQDIACWPRYLAPQLYLANADLFSAVGLSVETLQQQGLTWEDLLALGEQLRQLPDQPFVLASFDYQGLLAAVAPRQLDVSITAPLGWPDNAAAEAAERVQKLQQYGYLPSLASQEEYSGIQDFFSGRAALLAPAEPWLLQAVAERHDRLRRGLVNLSHAKPFPVRLVAPKLTATSCLPVRTEGLVVFRRRRAADEIKAAVEVSRHLSKSGTLAAKLDLLPAYQPAQHVWSVDWRWGNEHVLLPVLEHPLAIRPYPYTGLEGKGVQGRIR